MSVLPTALVIDDVAIVRSALARWLAPSFILVEAETITAARALLATRRYDVIFLDQRLPDGHGSELVPLIPDATALVAMSADLEPNDIRKLGGRPDAVLDKKNLRLACDLAETAIENRRRHPAAIVDRFAHQHRLSPAERRVVTLARMGLTDEEIAAREGVTRNAIESRWKSISRKSGSRRSAVMRLGADD